jgi:glycosyltransferase involved in cell wall biosynthesis
MNHRLSVIIPHYNDLARLEACLAALDRQTRRPDEVIVADNGSPEGVEVLKGAIAGRARLVVEPSRGAGPARNAGVAASTGDVLAFTDADCLPRPEWIERGLSALERFDLVGGAMEVIVPDEQAITPAEAFECVFAFDNRAYVETKGFSVTANLFLRRAVFDRTEGFRVGVPEDLDWCRRATGLGFRLGYAADALVGHPARRDWPELRRKWERLNAEAYGLKSGALGRASWLGKALLLPLTAIPHTVKVLRSDRLSRRADRLAATGMLWRVRTWRSLDSIRLLLRPSHPARSTTPPPDAPRP